MSLPSLFPMDEPVEPASGDAAESPPSKGQTPSNQRGSGQTQSLYRKYRPQSFDPTEMVGQDHVVQTLRNAILLDRVAHAYLFCGPRGTGKTTTARLLAKAVNCLDPDPLKRPCNACDNCRAITSGAATDVIEIDAASNRGIDDIRELRERVKYAPTQLRTKFYIIDEAHQITGAAANAFLKTLEEPPAHTKFILATTDPEELLPTIVSRCQRFDFRRIGLEAMMGRLRTVATAEGLTVDDEALAVIARHATGSLRDAEGLLDQLSVFRDTDPAAGGQTIDAESVRAVLGVSRSDRVETLVHALADRDAQLALKTVNAAVESGEDPRQLNRQLVAYLRRLLHERAGSSPDADETARALAGRFELLELARLARRFSEIDYRIRHSSYSQLPLEVALIESVLTQTGVRDESTVPSQRQDRQITPTQPPASDPPVARPPQPDPELLQRPPTSTLRDRLRGSTASAAPSPSPVERAEAAEPAQAPTPLPNLRPDPPMSDMSADGAQLSVASLADLWPQIRRDVKAINRRVEALLLSIDPVGISGDLITLSSPYEFHRSRLNTDEVRVVVEDVISRLLNRPVRVTCILHGEGTASASAGDSQQPTPERLNGATDSPNGVDTGGSGDDSATSSERDQQRIEAAKNIFDADEVPE